MKKYIAFISYSRKDKTVADWLHTKLESYILPDREKALDIFPTETKRGSQVMRLSKDGKYVDGVYLDFATTTTSFLDIAKFKKRNREYRRTPIDSIIQGYAVEFVTQTKDKIKSDSVYVNFYLDKNDMLADLKQTIKE